MLDSKEPLKVGVTWTDHKSMQSEYYVEVVNNLRVRAGAGAGAGRVGWAEGACLRDRRARARVCGQRSIPHSTSARFAVASTMMLRLLNTPFLHHRPHGPTVLAACSVRCCVRVWGRHVSQ